MNFELRCRASGATLALGNKFSGSPQRMVLHFPWFMTVSRVHVDGTQVQVKDGAVELPPAARTVEIPWSKPKGAPGLSYLKAVEDYKAEYRKRYEASVH